MSGGWRLDASSPFLTDRARIRAPQVLSYAAVTGGAFLVSPSSDIVLASGGADEVEARRIVRAAGTLGGARALTSFRVGKTCVHAAPVCQGWMLCVLSNVGVHPFFVIERLRRASHVLALALVDGAAPSSGGSGSGGAPAAVSRTRAAPPSRAR